MSTLTEESTGSQLHHGIPRAIFIEDATEYIKTQGFDDFEDAMNHLQELYRKYKYMEQNLIQRRRRLQTQVPDIKKNLEIVDYFLSRKKTDEPFVTTYELADQLYARAKVENTSRVGLWLGANVMLEYDVKDAKQMLEENLTAAEKNLKELDESLDFLKDQLTTSEVNLARLHNLIVKNKANSATGSGAAGVKKP